MKKFESYMLKTFEPNTKGRDFCIGDLHGNLDHLNKMLEGLSFDKTVDRMFSCGDLVDRGPNSFACLGLIDPIENPWFFAGQANHENMMQLCTDYPSISSAWFRNGGMWACEYINDIEKVARDKSWIPADESVRYAELVEMSKNLPFIQTVKLLDGKRAHIIHAEMPKLSLPLTDEMLEMPEVVEALINVVDYRGDPYIQWSREIFKYFVERPYDTDRDKAKWLQACVSLALHKTEREDLGVIISGHTPIVKPAWIGGLINLDTGAYKDKPWAALSCMELNTGKFYQVYWNTTIDGQKQLTFCEVDPIRIKGETILAAARGELETDN